jgi:iron complex outermembrane recepter protein
VLWLLLGTVWAQEAPADADEGDEEHVVEAPEDARAAMDRRLDADRVERFPARSSGELLRAMPGLHLTTHGSPGGGVKPSVRGFDDAYGSDMLVTVEGVPLNEVSNIHGHGYLDLHLIPADAVMRLDLRKGNDRAEWGDFAVVGSADYQLGVQEPGWTLRAGAVTDLGLDLMVAWRPERAQASTFVVAEVERGVHWAADRSWRQSRLAAGAGRDLGIGRAEAFVLAYDAEWDDPGAIRLADVGADRIDHYGSYGLNQGGVSRRVVLGGNWSLSRDHFRGIATAYAGGRWLHLVQNWTGYIDDPDQGDGTAQAHQATTLGLRAEAHQLWSIWGDYSVGSAGAEVRADFFQQFADAIEPDGSFVAIEDRVEGRQVDLATWTSLRLGIANLVKLTPGVRLDWTWLQERDLLETTTSSDVPQRSELVLQPKLSVAVRPADNVALFAAGGRSFRSLAVGQHSMKADAGELGVRASPLWFLDLQAATYLIRVSDEQVFDPATGREILAGPTQRIGFETVIDVKPRPWLDLQLDLSFTDARFLVDGTLVPYAPRFLGAAAVYLHELPLLGFTLSGGARAWALGARPLPHGFEGQRTLMVDVLAQADRGAWTFGASVKNLLNRRWSDGEYVYESWFVLDEEPSEGPAMHFTAGTPFTLQATVERQF